MKDERIGIKKQKLHRSKLTFEALKWDYSGWSMTIFDKITAFWKWQSELSASFPEDSEGKSVASWYRYHGYMQIKFLKNTDSKVENNSFKMRPVWAPYGYFWSS